MEDNESLFYDEEDVLPLDLFLAELDLVTSGMQKKASDARSDQSNGTEWSNAKSKDMQVALLELLPKIAITIPKAAVDKSGFKPMQARVISTFTSIIAHGLPPPLTRLICTCLDKIFASDLSSLYTFVADLQKNASLRKKDLSDPGLISTIDCLSHLSLKLGSYMAASAPSSLSIIKSILTATLRSTPSNDLLRSSALHLLASLCEGIHPSDKVSPTVHNEGWVVFIRHHSDLSHGDETRIQCISILRAIARSRSSILWLDGGARFNEAVKICNASLSLLSAPAPPATANSDAMMSESLQFIDQYSLALSDLALAAHPSLDLPKVHGIIDSRSAAVKKQLSFALEGVRRSALSTCLSSPLIQFASTPGGRPVCISLSIAWSSYVSSLLALRHKSDPQADIMMGAKTLDDEMIEMGMTLVLIGTAASVSASASVHHKSSPMVLSGGEMPLIESCCIYVLREIISSSSAHASKPGSVLGEVWRKRFLSQLSSMLSPGGEALSYKGGQSAPLSPPSIVIALKAISLLLDASGELLEDAWEKSQEQQLAPFSSSADVSPTTTSSIHFDPRLIKAAVVSQSSHLSSSVRHQAALTFESLALASPSSCSQMLSSALSALTGASTVLSSSSTPTSSPSTPLSADIIDKPDLDTSLGPFTILPSFPLSPPSPSHPIPTHTTNHTIGSQMAHVHGLALSVSSLIATASRLPLGCPSILFLNALALASKLVMRPRSIGVNGRAIEVEAGLILVGGLSLHSCLKQDGPMEGRTEQIMDLLNQTLGGEEAGEIDVLATRLSIHEVQLAHLNKNKIKGDILSTQTAAAVVQSIHEELCMKLWTQSAALRCIPTLIHHLLTLQENNNEVIAHISSLLSTLLNSLGDFIPGHTSKLLDVRASSGLLNACIVTFQFRLLKAFLSLPSPQWSSLSPRTHEQLFALSSQNMTLKTESTDEMLVFKSAVDAVAQILLSVHLSSDSFLGPHPRCPPGKDGFEDSLRSFAGEPGGPHTLSWEPLTHPQDSGGLHPSSIYPQPLSLDASLLSCNILVLSRLISTAPSSCSELETPVVKMSIVDKSLHFALSLATTFKGTLLSLTDIRLRGLSTALRQSCCLLASAIAIIGLKQISPGSFLAHLGSEACEQIVSIANAVLENHSCDTLLSRSASELFALSGSLGSEPWCHSVHFSLLSQLSSDASKKTFSWHQATAVALAIGSLHKKRGGISMCLHFSSAFEALMSLSDHALLHITGPTPKLTSKERLHILRALSCILHSLNHLAASSSSSFTSSHVNKVINLCCKITVSGINGRSCASMTASEEFRLTQQVSKLANGIIASLGPEFILGSDAYRWTRAILTGEMNSHGGIEPLINDWGGRRDGLMHLSDPLATCAATCYGLEAVGFIQQLSLFSPLALSRSASHRHLPLLRQAILSPLPGLRRAGITTLRTLAERELAESKSGQVNIPGSHSLVAEEMELELIHAYDAEDDRQCSAQIQQALLALMRARPSGSSSRSRWAALLSSVALAQDHSKTAHPSNEAKGADVDDEDYDQPPVDSKPTLPASPPPSQHLSSLRLGTRLMASELMLLLVSSHGDADPDPHHTADFIHQLVDIGFKAATGPTLALRPSGIELLRQVVLMYADFPDPLLQGGRLMSQFQAQIVSALRSSLPSSNHMDPNPFISAAGMSLATTFLESQICSDDVIVMRRLMDLLCTPLIGWKQGKPPGAGLELKYAEWVGIQYRVSLVRAHAQCFSLPNSSSVVTSAQSPFQSLLRDMWSCLVVDFIALSSAQPLSFSGYKSGLIIEPKALASLSSIPSLALLVGRKVSKGGVGDGQEEEKEEEEEEGLASTMTSIPQSMSLSALGAYYEAFPDALRSLSTLLHNQSQSTVNEIQEEGILHSSWFRVISSLFLSLDDIILDLKRSLLGDYGPRSRCGLSLFSRTSDPSNDVMTLAVEHDKDQRWQGQGGGQSRMRAQIVKSHINRLTIVLESISKLLSIEGLMDAPELWATVGPICSSSCDWVVKINEHLNPFLASNETSLLPPLKAAVDLIRLLALQLSLRSEGLASDLAMSLMKTSSFILNSPSYCSTMASSILDAALAILQKESLQDLGWHSRSLLGLGLKLMSHTSAVNVATSFLIRATTSIGGRMTLNIHLLNDGKEGEMIQESLAASIVVIADEAVRYTSLDKRDEQHTSKLPRLVSAALLCASFTEVKEARNHVVDTCLYLLGSSDAAVAQSALLGLLDFLQSDTSRDAVDDNGWKQRVVSDLCPQASLLAKRGLEPSSAFQSCVSPVVSCLIKACSLQADASSLQDPKLLIIVSILIQATEIDHLKAMAIKSLSSFPSHPSLGPAFSDCLRQLPSDLKSRLQASIKAAAALPRADEPPTAMRPLPPPPISSISKGPMIQLKRFI